MFDRLRRVFSAQGKPVDNESAKPAAPATGDTQLVTFYGHRLTFERGLMALEIGQLPPYLTKVDMVMMRCVAPVHRPGQRQVQACGELIQMYANFRPVAYICPWCFSVYVFPDPKAEKPKDADGESVYHASDSFFCYGLYGGHRARTHLHETIQQATTGKGLLVAHRMSLDSFTGIDMPLGKVLFAPGQVTEDDLRKMERSARQISMSIVERALQHSERRDDETVLGLAERAAIVDPTFAIPYRLIGDALDELGLSETAIDYYRKALAIEPNNSEVIGNIAAAYTKLGRSQDAEHHYREALRLSPNNVIARAGLAYNLIDLGRLDDAARELAIAHRLKPDSLEYAFNLGTAYFRAGHHPEALSAFRESLQLAPQDPDVHQAIGEVMFATGRLQEAVSAWRTGARLGSDEAQKRLREIGG